METFQQSIESPRASCRSQRGLLGIPRDDKRLSGKFIENQNRNEHKWVPYQHKRKRRQRKQNSGVKNRFPPAKPLCKFTNRNINKRPENFRQRKYNTEKSNMNNNALSKYGKSKRKCSVNNPEEKLKCY